MMSARVSGVSCLQVFNELFVCLVVRMASAAATYGHLVYHCMTPVFATRQRLPDQQGGNIQRIYLD